ncbi:LPXTG cell wall anchor domain-containing protein, partial [Streptomyces radiopugnans]|uniref:LPXTG cell wall anchor domain-containing protein n=1 Tax=Streptomyces radiopugnans TaxID=403935 RepID=UPI003F19DCC0
STSAPASPSAEPSPSEGPAECSDEDEEFLVDEDLLTGLSGLPSKVVAGSGFHAFQLTVTNTSDTDYRRVDFGVFTAQIDEENWNVTTGHLTLQYQDPATGAWKNISLDENDEGVGYVGYSVVKAHTSYSVNLRLSVDAAAPAGLGFAVTIGMYANDAGACVYAGDDSYYEFEILKAGAKPGEVPGAKPQGGAKKPVPSIKPVGDTEIKMKGTLAQTGSSSALPTIALIGGVTMAVGAGAVFAVRRRKTSGPQATA